MVKTRSPGNHPYPAARDALTENGKKNAIPVSQFATPANGEIRSLTLSSAKAHRHVTPTNNRTRPRSSNKRT
eukprot:1502656-Prymnesium_polylepis.1